MRTTWRSALSFSLTLGLAACDGWGKGDETSTTTTTSTTGVDGTGGASETGNVGATTPQETTAQETSGPGDGSATSEATTLMVTTASTSEGTTGGESTTGSSECVPDPQPPGSCDGAPPKRSAVKFAAPVVGGVKAGQPRKLADAADDDEQFATSGASFIVQPDVGGSFECDIYTQDCDPGEKCTAWANDGSAWNATRCVPVVVDPNGVGEPCTAEGNGLTGFDTCDKGALCWGASEDDDQGTCVELCGCSEANPVCETAGASCVIFNDGALPLCLPACDPLDPLTCAGGEVCVGIDQSFQCVLDASHEGGQAGTPCEFANACDPGLLCGINPGGANDCGGQGCCTPYCDLGDPVCPPGLACTPYFEVGQAPQCLDDVGACVAP